MPASSKKQDKSKSEHGSAHVLKGVYMFPNGDKYDGEYIQANGGLQRSGYGENLTAGGLCYQGYWSDDKMNGQGKLIHPSGAVYEGEFVENRFHGYGKYTWPDGSIYQGNFSENKLEGHGTFTDINKQVWHGNFTHKAAPGLKFKLDL
ncbi:MORN repeat-containing protein 2-like isoform X2 [Actinia tenebrosa]|uniref:MORN repeat-containing protein 2-like isoform X2 n=1 Tax=Actinia tenebrosa TaxID=6105 RepID=A0A6P8IFP1_ACTTE|nr:MORN repeat-containing protein 2-like isoform X2 [Actinia tenebrosa]